MTSWSAVRPQGRGPSFSVASLSPYKPNSVIWNAEAVLEVVRKHKNVVCWFAGEYLRDEESGMHMLVPPTLFECTLDEPAFGIVEVCEDALCFKLHWTGKLPRRTVEPWPEVLHFPPMEI